jgi:hypothetical protein
MHTFTHARAAAATLALSTALAFAPPALASGGLDSGGSGGGGGGGGTTTTTTTTSSSSCAKITAFSNSTGYYSIWAAIWTSYGISSSCSGQVNWQMTYFDGNTGAVDFSRSGYFYGSGTSGTVDEDWAAFSTPYTVTLTVTDSTGNVLATQSAVVTTKSPKTGA